MRSSTSQVAIPALSNIGWRTATVIAALDPGVRRRGDGDLQGQRVAGNAHRLEAISTGERGSECWLREPLETGLLVREQGQRRTAIDADAVELGSIGPTTRS